jgi:benzoyl-CoA reductase/2-hydroxyglutaryl-CoA dehydratase subunit BcrC/BadD/HgdB
MSRAFETLLWHYHHRSAEALAQHKAGVPVVGFTSNAVPWELIRAAGCFPVLLSPDIDALEAPTPFADPLMEPTFDSRMRSIFDRLLAGSWSFLRLLIIPRTSEPEYKLYLYLREVARQNLSHNLPPVHLYDLLHTRSKISSKYGFDRTKDLAQHLKQFGAITPGSMAKAIAESNRARAALRRLQRLRTPKAPKISGTDALAISGAHYFMDRVAYAKLVNEVCKEFEKDAKSAPFSRRPRLLIKGMPLHHPGLHRALESQGAVVIVEDDWWGSRAAGPNIPIGKTATALVRGIFEEYYLRAPSPRILPSAAADLWFQRSVERRSNGVKPDLDGVVFYLPPDDDVYGWDYPRQRDFVHARGIPSLLIREDAARGFSRQTTAQIEQFTKSIGGRRNVARD